MKRIAVIYQSKYGTTKRYAEWIADALNAALLERTQVKPKQLTDYDIVVYGGGLYAGGIIGADLVTKHSTKALVVFTDGLTDPARKDFSELLAKHFSAELRQKAHFFHFRGGIDYAKLSKLHRGMMAMIKKLMLDKKPPEQHDAEGQALLESYGKQADYTDKTAIEPLVACVRGL